MTRSDAVAFEKAWREAAQYASQHNEARIVVENQCTKLRTELKESERLRSLETQRLAAQIEKMRVELVNERERIQNLEREFSLAFEEELSRLRQKHESETTKEAIIVVERLKKEVHKSEREKADLMSKLAALEKTTKQIQKKKNFVSAYSGSAAEQGFVQDGVMWSILMWDAAAVIVVMLTMLAILYGAFLQSGNYSTFGGAYHPAPDYDYAAPAMGIPD
ncbi:unnamed protein product [Amoebophrya sp. A120]|nr:unnamed protein product [Amoebophrya sp. A120]|eukprot:GSA120T00006810001.1